MRKPFEKKIGKVKFTAEPLGVMEGMVLEGRVTAILAKALKVAGTEVAALFGGDSGILDSDELFGARLFEVVGEFREHLNWEDFMALVVDSCEGCNSIINGNPVPVDVEDLDRTNLEHYKLASWYLECQLGPFIGLIKPFLKAPAGANQDSDSSTE